MPQQIRCPQCQGEVNFADHELGRDKPCPRCQTPVTASGLADQPLPGRHPVTSPLAAPGHFEAPPPTDLPSYSEGVPSIVRQSTWKSVELGLSMILWVLIICLVLFPVVQVINVFVVQTTNVPPGGAPGQEELVPIALMGGAGCVMFLVLMVGFVGICLCCTAPAEANARGQAIATVVCLVAGFVVSLLLGMVIGFMGMQQAAGGPPDLEHLMASPLGLAAVVAGQLGHILAGWFWFGFHRRIGRFFQQPSLVQQSWLLVSLWIIYCVGNGVLGWMNLSGGDLHNPPYLVHATIWSIAFLEILGLWYAFYLAATRRVLQS